jgi:hypothetical protein
MTAKLDGMYIITKMRAYTSTKNTSQLYIFAMTGAMGLKPTMSTPETPKAKEKHN